MNLPHKCASYFLLFLLYHNMKEIENQDKIYKKTVKIYGRKVTNHVIYW
ncbi:hypothetical protein B4100_0034 [Heyndrickxia coagulans]|nr:hypothetical protein B4100_0034 [Heyndrickxia coagulans]